MCLPQEESSATDAPAERGQHTREMLLELGYTPEDTGALARKAVVRGADLTDKGVSDSDRLAKYRIA